MQKENIIPALRFTEFTEEWEQCKLGDMAKFTKGTGYSKADLKGTGNPIILYGRLYTDYETVIRNVNTCVDAKPGSVYSQGGEVIVPASGETAEDISIASVVEKPGIILGGDLNIITPSETLDSAFLAISISNGKPHSDMAKMAQGKSVVPLHNTDLCKIELCYPNIIEQKHISRFLNSLDSLISLYQHKYNQLYSVKTAVLENMFPREGATVPEIRFAEFSSVWKRYKFSELYEKVSRKNDMSYGKDDIISVANMYYKPDSYITEDDYLLTYNIFEVGDIAFEGNKSRNFAHGRFVENIIGNGIVSHVFEVFRPIMYPYDLFFWKYLINNERIMGNILIRCTKASTMMTNLVANDFLRESILVPSYEEQKAIGSFLSYLDNFITLHQRKLERMKSLKKAFLEKMFV